MTADERQSEIMKDVFRLNKGGVKTATGVRAVANGMWATAHNEELPHDQMLQAMSLLSGMATAALWDYAKLLEEKEDGVGR